MARNIQSPARLVVLALAVVMALPVFAFAQGRGRGKPTEVFVNGHDARDGRWDRDGRRDRRNRRDRDDDDYYRRRRNDGSYGRNDGRYGRNDGRYGRNDGYYGRDSYNQQLRQVALNNGYNEGIDEGRKDADRGDRFDYYDEGDYRSGTKGYNSRYGNKDLYRQYFREGFARGYRQGYERGNYGYGRDDDYRNRRGSSVGDILGGIFGRP